MSVEERNSEFARTGRRYVAIARGDYAEALRLDASDPPSLAAATLLAAQGDLGAAREQATKRAEEVKRELQAQPANAGLWSMLGQIEALLGYKEDALRCARQATTLMPESRDAIDGPTYSHDLSVVQAWIGEKEAAIAGFARLLQMPGTQLANNVPMTVHMMRRDPRYSPLWGDPRFEVLLNDPKNNAPLF